MGSRLCVVLLLLLSIVVQCSSARSSPRQLGVYRSSSPGSTSGSSPIVESPPTSSSSYSPPSSGSSPVSEGPSSSYTPPSSGSSPVVEGPASSYTPPSSGSSPVVETPPTITPPYSSSPSSGSSPTIGSPTGSPLIGSPISSPITGSPLSSPVVGSPFSAPSPFTSTPVGGGSPTPVIGTTPPSGSYGGHGKGTCRFWSGNGIKFPSILSRLASLARIFGGKAPSIFGGKMTLMEALVNPNQDEFSSLARQGTASLLNAYAYENFAFTPEDVRQKLSAALESPEAARQQALAFEQANNAV